MRLFLISFLFFSTLFAECWTLQDMMRVGDVENVLVSPDGKRVLYTVKQAVMEEKKSEWKNPLYVTTTLGENTRIFTREESVVEAPTWSPDGKWIAYILQQEEKDSVWLLPADGGESKMLFENKNTILFLEFSPDGSKLALLMKDPKTEEEEKKKEHKLDVFVADENLKSSHLWIYDLKKNALTRYTEGSFHISSPFSAPSLSFSPDGKEIVFSKMPSPDLNDWKKAEIWRINLETKEMKKVAGSAFGAIPIYSPDGKWIAYSRYEMPVRWEYISDVVVVRADGGEAKVLAETFNRDSSVRGEIIGWSSKSDAVFVSETNHTKTTIYKLGLDGSCQILDFGNRFIPQITLNKTNEIFGFISESTVVPKEAFVRNVNQATITQVSHVNEKLPLERVAKTEVIEYSSKDGQKIEALLTYPQNYQKGKSYPLLLIIHGGPTSLYQENFIGGPSPYPIATFASDGYAILRCNIRGSTGYGKEFRIAIVQEWGGIDYIDLMSGVDHLIKQGIANPHCLGVMGWSYGGYMTAWILTQTHRFKAASVGAGVIDLPSMSGTSDITSFLPDHFQAELWDDYDFYLNHSAIRHVKNIKTPTLIQHGRGDERVPLSQSYMLYNALKRLGVPTKLVIYPRSGHAIKEPKFILDAAERNVAWFQKYIE